MVDAPRSTPSHPDGDDWTLLSRSSLVVGTAHDWVVRPDCGAVVVFTGTARDHSPDRSGITGLEYEAYEEHVEPRLAAIVTEVRSRWPATGRVAIWHRVGPVAVGEVSVVAAVSTPHRAEAFEAARFAIDTLKSSVPLWKREVWDDGDAWVLDGQPVREATSP